MWGKISLDHAFVLVASSDEVGIKKAKDSANVKHGSAGRGT